MRNIFFDAKKHQSRSLFDYFDFATNYFFKELLDKASTALNKRVPTPPQLSLPADHSLFDALLFFNLSFVVR